MEINKDSPQSSRALVFYFFMVNVYSFFNGNKSATKYNLSNPAIDEYLDVDIDDFYTGTDSDEYIITLL